MTFIVTWVKAVVAVDGATVTRAKRDLGNYTAGRADGFMYFAL